MQEAFNLKHVADPTWQGGRIADCDSEDSGSTGRQEQFLVPFAHGMSTLLWSVYELCCQFQYGECSSHGCSVGDEKDKFWEWRCQHPLCAGKQSGRLGGGEGWRALDRKLVTNGRRIGDGAERL